jgi:hypothetical protein
VGGVAQGSDDAQHRWNGCGGWCRNRFSVAETKSKKEKGRGAIRALFVEAGQLKLRRGETG